MHSNRVAQTNDRFLQNKIEALVLSQRTLETSLPKRLHSCRVDSTAHVCGIGFPAFFRGQMFSKANGKRNDGMSRVGKSARRKYRTAANIAVANPEEPKIGIYDAVAGRTGHAGGARVVEGVVKSRE